MPLRRRSRARAQGFTLVELMVSVAIVAMLAAIASPNYRKYTERARVTAMLAELSGGKVGVEILMMEGTIGPSLTPSEVGLNSPTELCSKLTVTADIRPGRRRAKLYCLGIKGNEVELWYSSTEGWSCNAVATLNEGWAPATCKPYFEVNP